MKDSDNYFILISGTGRSGTNVTKEILNKSKNVFSLPFEYRFTVDPNGIIDLYSTLKNNWSPYIVEAKVEASKRFLYGIGKRSFIKYWIGKLIRLIDNKGLTVSAPPYFEWELSKWFPNYYFHLDNLFHKLIDFKYKAVYPGSETFKLRNRMSFVRFNKDLDAIFSNFINSLIADLLHQKNKTHFVEDNTWSILFVEILMKLVPNSKLLHVYRDPRDVVVSLISQRWAPSKLSEVILYYSSIMDKIIDAKKTIPSERIIEVSLEKLISSPEDTIKKICSFCEVEYNRHMLETDLSHANSGRWLVELNEDEQKEITKSLSKYIKLYGYS